jgi:type VI secretion system secreted protein VgrG
MTYLNTFTCIPSQLPFRPARKTPKPFVQGVQNALVTGPPGEEIFTDKYGRVKVQFYWDREGKKDANSSCWLRVGTLWAGKGWGSINIPRIGQEVIVAFVEGNPDEPLIVGSLYNRETMPANTLPDKKVVCGLKSNTHKGKGYNEMSMDDTAGKEKISIHAQYDMDTMVEHDQTETIKNNSKIEISEGTYKHDVKTGTANYHVQSALTEVYDATQDTTVKSNLTIKSTGGAIVVSADSQNIYIHAATNVQIQTGASMLWMASNGDIELSGKNVAIIGKAKVYVQGGDVVSAADNNHEISGQAVKSAGAVTNTVTGGMVMLNP